MIEQIAYLMILAAAVAVNDGKRFYCCYVIFLTYIANIVIYHSDYFYTLVDLFGFHAYLAVYDLIIIGLLSINTSRLALVIITLCIIDIVLNMFAYWLSLYGDITGLFDWSMRFVFLVQAVFLFSKRITDGIANTVATVGVLRSDSNHCCENVDKGHEG